MSDKLNKDSARAKFRSSIAIKDFSALPMDPDYDYKYVCATFTEGLKRIDHYIDRNWEVVYSKEKPKDDRKNSAQQDGTNEDLRSSPVSITTKGGHTQILMRIKKEDRAANALENAKRDEARLDASRKATTTKTKDGFVTRSDVDPSKLK